MMSNGFMTNPPVWMFVGVWIWLAFWAVASALVRRWRGRPLLASPPTEARYVERWISGQHPTHLLSRLGGASRCLQVAVTPSHLLVQPQFPFTLLFVPEAFDLDLEIPLDQLRAARVTRNKLSSLITIDYQRPSGAQRSVLLQPRRPDEFMTTLGQMAPHIRSLPGR